MTEIEIDNLAELLCAVLHDKPRPPDLFRRRPSERRTCPLHLGLAVRVATHLGDTHA